MLAFRCSLFAAQALLPHFAGPSNPIAGGEFCAAPGRRMGTAGEIAQDAPTKKVPPKKSAAPSLLALLGCSRRGNSASAPLDVEWERDGRPSQDEISDEVPDEAHNPAPHQAFPPRPPRPREALDRPRAFSLVAAGGPSPPLLALLPLRWTHSPRRPNGRRPPSTIQLQIGHRSGARSSS